MAVTLFLFLEALLTLATPTRNKEEKMTGASLSAPLAYKKVLKLAIVPSEFAAFFTKAVGFAMRLAPFNASASFAGTLIQHRLSNVELPPLMINARFCLCYALAPMRVHM